jgi:tetratricopeptide (TPR) repeat protein
MVFYQAALLVNVENHLASNDLGVLLAQAGRYEDARMALEHSLALHQGSTGWHNLAKVYQNLGQNDLARRAALLAQNARQKEMTQMAQAMPSSHQPVGWVDPQAFAQAAGQTLPTTPSPQAAPVAPPAPTEPSNVARSLFRLPNFQK